MVSWEVIACFPARCWAQNPLQGIKPPCGSPSHSRWRPALHHSLAGARLGDGTHYRWEVTPGSRGQAWPARLANLCSSVLSVKPREWAPAPGKRVGRKPVLPDRHRGRVDKPRAKRIHGRPSRGEPSLRQLPLGRVSAFRVEFQQPGVYQASFCLGPQHPQEPRVGRAP